MNQAEKNDDEFDVERLRKQVSEIRTITAEETSAGKRPSQPAELNDFAKRVAAQFRDEKFSPSMMTGLFRLVDFLMLFAIGSAISFGYVQEDRVMPVYTLTIAAGAALSVLFVQLADGYQLPVLRAPRHGLGRLVGAWTLSFAVMAMGLFFMKASGTYSSVWFAGWFLAGASYLVAERYIVAWAGATSMDWWRSWPRT